MLLDAKSQRTKSWSCEHCRNYVELHDPIICRRCFWAYPDDYDHVAMRDERRVDIVWQGTQTSDFEQLADRASHEATPLSELLKRLGREEIERIKRR